MLHLRILSTLFWVFVVVSSALLFPVALLIWLLLGLVDRRGLVLHRFTCLWASLYSWLNPAWPLTIEGREKLDDSVPTILIANHLSLLDILVLFRLFKHFKWVSKIEVFRVPFVGWNMYLNRYISLRRGDRASIKQMLARCEETLARGSSILMFPEGTRSADGRLKPFKPGAFGLAKRTARPLQPILIEGTSDALPKKGYVLRGKHPIRIRVLDRIEPESFVGEDTDALVARVHELFERELGGAPAEVPGP